MSSESNQGYLSSKVDLFVSSTGNSVHVILHGISVVQALFFLFLQLCIIHCAVLGNVVLLVVLR